MLDGDALVKLYDDTIATPLDRQVRVRTVTRRRRPSNAWYDEECRSAKSSERSLERAACRAAPLSESDATLPEVIAWRTERWRYFDLVRQKRPDYFMMRVDSERLRPRGLWQSLLVSSASRTRLGSCYH